VALFSKHDEVDRFDDWTGRLLSAKHGHSRIELLILKPHQDRIGPQGDFVRICREISRDLLRHLSCEQDLEGGTFEDLALKSDRGELLFKNTNAAGKVGHIRVGGNLFAAACAQAKTASRS